jgi:superfamily II DNA helicase RecQ
MIKDIAATDSSVPPVARFVRETKAERVICLTATATVKVVEDICAAFEIEEQGVFRTSPYRPK